ncbi:MAG: DHH family phosphoesterase [Candidatus Aenigmarchaeota archaeon]|nr:DHH family phosphoesterase [Candidatus Aenigmarchaeota archaeon]
MKMVQMKKAVNFLENIKKTDEIVVVFNNDGDGISSCVLLNKFLAKTGRKKPYIINQPMPMDKNIIQRIQTTVPHKIIFLDIAADQQQNVLKKLGGICDMMIVDHHQVFKNMNQPKDASSMRRTSVVVHYNPRMERHDVYQSTSYCVYKICSKIIDMSEDLWIAGVGMVSDYNLNDSKDLVKILKEKYGLSEPLYGTKLGRIADMISATRAVNALSCEQMVEVLEKANFEGFEEAKNADKMIEARDAIEKEMASLLQDVEEHSEKIGKILFYNIKSKFNLGSSLSTKVSENFQKDLVIIYERSGNRVKVSARNQAKNINAGLVLQRAASSAGGSGGGHEAAAGATISAENWEKFREILIKSVNKS